MATLLHTARDVLHYDLIRRHASLAIDTRNAFSTLGNDTGKVFRT